MSKHAFVMIVLAVPALPAMACNADDGSDVAAGGEAVDDGHANDEQICRDAARELWQRECPPGFAPLLHHGTDAVVALIDDVGVSYCGGLGYWVDADARAGAEWIGYDVTQNSACAFGCFASQCRPEQSACFGRTSAGGACVVCSHDIDEQSCERFVLECAGIEPGGGSEDEGCGGDSAGGMERQDEITDVMGPT